jgi:hypothetical protein
MESSESVARSVLDLTPEAFFAYDLSLELEITDRLAAHRFEGLALGAPREVDVSHRETLPVIAVSVESGRREEEVDFKRNWFLAAVDLGSGRVLAGPAFRIPAGKRPFRARNGEPEEPPMDPAMAEARVTGCYCFDLREAVDLPWRSGVVAVTLFSYDWVSNTALVTLVGGTAPAPTAEAPSQEPPLESGLVATYGRTRQSPAVAGLGVALSSAPGPAGTGPGLQGAFRVTAGAPVRSRADSMEDRHAAAPLAAVPVTVALVRLNRNRPRLLEMQVPVSTPPPVGEGSEVEGFFTLASLTAIEPPLVGGEYQAYAIVDRHVAGPERLVLP